MQKLLKGSNILHEEKRAMKWFLILFYTVLVSYDIIYDFILPKYIMHAKTDSPSFWEYTIYISMFVLILFVIYANKIEKHYLIKYVYFTSYTLLSIINETFTYFGKPEQYSSGNVVEIFWLILSPIFVSSPFYWTVTIGLLIKYAVVGVAIQSLTVFFPMMMISIFSVFSFILLNRFQAYVKAISASYNQQLMGIVKGVIATLELKDPYTRGHSERVAEYALEFARVVGKHSKEELDAFNFACLLHDIGKIHIPDHILMKPASLTKEEYEVIKIHPIVGAEAVSDIMGLKDSTEVIRSHHERWDGAGYPDQLKGEEIPYFARIAAIADSFDAMTSSRSYRSALSVEDAYKRIIEGKGTQFDPDLIEIFIKVYGSWKDIHNKWEIKSNESNLQPEQSTTN